jgi:DNA-binding GntR family transcriptional regulator
VPVLADERSLAMQAYEAIKLRVITLEYPPGSSLVESRICADLGIGRTPVHEAISRLAIEGMIEILPRKGVVVRPVSLDEALATIEARLINEPMCARLAAQRATADDLLGIEQVLRQAPPLLGRRDIKGLMLLDRQFHGAIARAARNKVLEQVLQQLHEKSLRFWFISLSDSKHLLQVDKEHRDVLTALQARDPEKAERTGRAHIESFRDTIKRSV